MYLDVYGVFMVHRWPDGYSRNDGIVHHDNCDPALFATKEEAEDFASKFLDRYGRMKKESERVVFYETQNVVIESTSLKRGPLRDYLAKICDSVDPDFVQQNMKATGTTQWLWEYQH